MRSPAAVAFGVAGLLLACADRPEAAGEAPVSQAQIEADVLPLQCMGRPCYDA